jgi:hypothetical protein
VDWPVHDDEENGERYFAVITDCEAVADIVATAPATRASLQRFFPAWFSKGSELPAITGTTRTQITVLCAPEPLSIEYPGAVRNGGSDHLRNVFSKNRAMIPRASSVIRPKGSDLIFDHPYNAGSVSPSPVS